MNSSADASTSQRDSLALLARVPVLLGVAMAAALLWLRQPYRGLRHDALLYAGQAVSHLDPGWAANDFFFRYGSQDQFTLFSNALGELIRLFGIPGPEIVLLIASQLLSLFALHLITFEWPAPRRWLALITVAGLSHFFGAAKIFSLFEPFVTARTLAEPAAFLAIAALLRGRLVLAGGALLFALAMHPLVALPLAVVGWFYLMADDRRWAWAGLAVVPVLAAMHAGVQPFVRLAQVYDGQWLHAVDAFNSAVFISEWVLEDTTMMLGQAVLLWLALRGREGRLARFSRSSLCAALVLCLVSYVGADWYHDVLITQLQLWRVLWIVHLLFVLWLPTFILDEWRKGAAGRLAAVALFFVAPTLAELFANGWALVIWALAMVALSARGVVLEPRIHRLALVACFLVGLLSTGMIAWSVYYQQGMHLRGTALTSAWSTPFTLAVLTIPAATSLLLVAARGGRAGRVGQLAIAALFVVALVQLDQRTQLARFVESTYGQPHPFQAVIPPDAEVLWEDAELAPTWFMLRRASFAGGAQFAGLLFSRPAAMVGLERFKTVMPVFERLEKCRMLEGMTHGNYRFEDCEMPEDVFFGMCAAKDHPAFLVTHLAYSRRPVASWTFEPKDGSAPVTYHLHDCKAAR